MRILVTGSRNWVDASVIRVALEHADGDLGRGWNEQLVVVHGNAAGADRLADVIADDLGWNTEAHPWQSYGSPRARNQHMVGLGADVCLAFATSWASGTGMCARMARQAGIPTHDYGVNTEAWARPGY